MDLSITVFERKVGRRLHWQTVGLGVFDREVDGPTRMKVQHRLFDSIRKRLRERFPEQLEAIEFVSGRKLEVVSLEINVGHGGTRRRIRGKFPLIVEPRTRGAAVGGQLMRVFHPYAPSQWFTHDESRVLADEAALFFKPIFSEMRDDQIERFQAQSKDSLKIVALSVATKKLADKLERKKKPALAFMGAPPREKGESLLSRLGTNQTLRAVDDRLDRGMARSPHREQLRQLLCGETKAPALLVGPSGVGKSMLLQRLVFDLLDADDYPSHRNLDKVFAVWRISGRRIIAGMSYLGQWEQRCVDLLETCREKKIVLWLDDVAAWGRIGESRESDRSLATFFRGPLARGEVAVVAECSPEGYQRLLDDAPGFAAAFTSLFVEPTTTAETMRMLVHEARALELKHDIAFDPRAFRTIYDLGGALASGTAYPGRALDLLRTLATGEHGHAMDLRRAELAAGSGQKIQAIKSYRDTTGVGLRDAKDAVEAFMMKGIWPAISSADRKQRHVPVRSLLSADFGSSPGAPEIGPSQVIELLARRTGMPAVMLTATRPLSADRVADVFRGQIMGQYPAVLAMRDLVVRIKSGIVDASRPYGVFLFTGPTGTGKTEMAKCVAEYLFGDEARLLRFDMSEYSGPDAPARLIGDRYRPEGGLTSKVRAQPFCVVLLDEVEKASPAVLNLMLQLFDDGRLTDATGTVIDFRHTVVIMTSNLGAKSAPSVGFEDATEIDIVRDVDAAVREFFPPELFNRIDRVVPFSPLSHSAARKIARQELSRLLQRRGLTERNIFVRFTDAVVDLAVRDGFNQRDGARSLKRYLEDRIGGYLADEIARRQAAAVRVFWLYLRDGNLEIRGEHLREAEAIATDEGVREVAEWSGQRLRAEVPAALAQVERLIASDSVAELAEQVDKQLARFRIAQSEGDAGDAVFNLDRLRGELQGIAETLQTQMDYDPLLADAAGPEHMANHEGELVEAQDFGHIRKAFAGSGGQVVHFRTLDWRYLGPSLPLPNRPKLLEALGSLYFLEHAVATSSHDDQHAILIELTRITRSASTARFAAQRSGLVEWLVEAYGTGRGEIDAVAAVDDDGNFREFRHAVRLSQWANARAVIRVVGPAVRAFFEGEHGTHIRESLSGGAEIVRVRVLPAKERSPSEHLRSLDASREAFVRALESGAEDLPDNPDLVLPIVRRYHYEPSRAGEQSPIDVEDYPLQHAATTYVRSLADVLPMLWFLRLGGKRGDG